MSSVLDCIVVGYNDVDFDGVVRAAHDMRDVSGAYRQIQTNSVLRDGKRQTYMTLLNQAIEEATGRNPHLHVARMPSLGAWYLRSFLVQNGYGAEVVNSFNHEKERLIGLLEQSPRAVAITTTFYVGSEPIREIISFIREYSATTRIVLGGPHVYNLHEAFAADPFTLGLAFEEIGADIYIVDSQGELTLTRVLSHLRGEGTAHETRVAPGGGKNKSNSLPVLSSDAPTVRTTNLRDIPNLAFFAGDDLVLTPRERESNDMDVFTERWEDVPSARFVPTVVTRTARSCAFSCSFCRYPVVAGPLNLKSVEVIERDFRHFQERGVRQVVIIDDTFNVPLPRFKAICRMMARNRFDFEWFSYFRAANADEECFDLMAESRCGGVFLGIESGDQTILTNMNKSASVDRYLTSIRALTERDIITFASLIVGFPGETEETIRNTIAFVREGRPTYYRAELYFHGTNAPIQQRAGEFGIVGAGYSWRHKTMDWKRAALEIETMYGTIEESVVLPLYMFDFWCIPYLLGQGLSKAQIHRFASTAQRILHDELERRAPDGSDRHLADLRSIFEPPQLGYPAAGAR